LVRNYGVGILTVPESAGNAVHGDEGSVRFVEARQKDIIEFVDAVGKDVLTTHINKTLTQAWGYSIIFSVCLERTNVFRGVMGQGKMIEFSTYYSCQDDGAYILGYCNYNNHLYFHPNQVLLR